MILINITNQLQYYYLVIRTVQLNPIKKSNQMYTKLYTYKFSKTHNFKINIQFNEFQYSYF